MNAFSNLQSVEVSQLVKFWCSYKAISVRGRFGTLRRSANILSDENFQYLVEDAHFITNLKNLL